MREGAGEGVCKEGAFLEPEGTELCLDLLVRWVPLPERDRYGKRCCGKGSEAAAVCAQASPRAASWRSVETENQRNRSVYQGNLHQAMAQVIFFFL